MDLISIGIISTYFLLLFGIAYISSRKESEEGFLLADRKLNGINSAFSVIASKIGAGTLLAFIAYIYVFGLPAIGYVIGAAVGYVSFIFLARKVRTVSDEKKYYTLMDYMRDKLGEKNSIWVAITLFVGSALTYVVQIIGGGKIISALFNISFTVSVVFMLIIILTYLLAGGFRAVVYTDVLQGIAFIAVFIAIGAVLTNATTLTPTFDALPLGLTIGFLILGFIYPFGSHDLWQRVYATRKDQLIKSLVIASIGYVSVGVILVWLGWNIKSILPGIDPDTALVVAFTTFLDPVWRTVAATAFFSVVMSSADTVLFNCTSILAQDIFRKKTVLRKTFRKLFVGLTIAGAICAILFKDVIDVVLIYAAIMVLVGSFVVFDWWFSPQQKHMPKTYVMSVVLLVLVMFISDLDPVYAVAGIMIVPCSYVISKLLFWIQVRINQHRS